MSIKWTRDRITLEAKKYNSHTDFWKGAAQAVKVAKRDNYYNEITKHFKEKLVKHTKESCIEAALLCKTKEEFKKNIGINMHPHCTMGGIKFVHHTCPKIPNSSLRKTNLIV
jgi:hypothetical protein